MVLPWRKRMSAAKKQQNLEIVSRMELTIPSHFRCPISLDLMKDPVTLETGITYDRESIETWIEGGNRTCPVTNRVLSSLEPIPNHTLRMMIQDWSVENSSCGIERIPTPKIPISSHDVFVILSNIEVAAKDGEDAEWCKEMVVKIKEVVKESERNKRCILRNGSGRVLATAFEAFSKGPFDQNVAVLEEILAALTMMSPLDQEAKDRLGESRSLDAMIWFLRDGSLIGRRNSVLLLTEVVSNDREKINEFAEVEGGMEALFKLIKEPISPSSTKAALLLIYQVISDSSFPPNSKAIAKLLELGLLQILVEMLVDCEKSICEKALGVLDEICSSDEGRKKARGNDLTVPVLVKKILRVSDLATQFSVSILWNLGKNDGADQGGRRFLVQALEFGAFQKLLLLLQIGCAERTKEKASEVLKLLNLYRDGVECIDSLDFKNLKRPL